MVKIRIARSEAVIDGWKWTSDNPVLAEHLNSLLDERGPDTSDPDPDHTAAIDACRRYDGEVLEADGEEPDDGDDGRIF